jgi:hypothetical protein
LHENVTNAMPSSKKPELRFPVRLTQAQRKVVAGIGPELAGRLKLDKRNQRTGRVEADQGEDRESDVACGKPAEIVAGHGVLPRSPEEAGRRAPLRPLCRPEPSDTLPSGPPRDWLTSSAA